MERKLPANRKLLTYITTLYGKPQPEPQRPEEEMRKLVVKNWAEHRNREIEQELRKAEEAERKRLHLEAERKKEKEDFEKDTVTLRQPFGEHVLEEVYSFSRSERITMMRRRNGGPVEAMSREGFSSIDDKTRLHEAFDAYAAKGGTIDENAIFSHRLGKPKLPQLQAPGLIKENGNVRL